MIQKKKTLILALSIPILVLGLLTAHKEYIFSSGNEVILPISAYDPRSILSGRYLVYQIDYGVTGICPDQKYYYKGYVCLDPKKFSYTKPFKCAKLIRGVCKQRGQFRANIERFYVPEDKAKALGLQLQIQSHSASIKLSFTSSGQVQVKDLLINGQSWKKR